MFHWCGIFGRVVGFSKETSYFRVSKEISPLQAVFEAALQQQWSGCVPLPGWFRVNWRITTWNPLKMKYNPDNNCIPKKNTQGNDMKWYTKTEFGYPYDAYILLGIKRCFPGSGFLISWPRTHKFIPSVSGSVVWMKVIEDLFCWSETWPPAV